MLATLLGNIPGATLYSILGYVSGSLAGTQDYHLPARSKFVFAT